MLKTDITEIENGIIKCSENSEELISDAKLLFQNNRYARAYSLLQLATEETAKIKILLRIALEKRANIFKMDRERSKYFNDLFKNHDGKNRLAVLIDSNINDFAKELNLKEFRESKKISNELNNIKNVDILKQDGFYVRLHHNSFQKPSDIFTQKKCAAYMDIVVRRRDSVITTMNFYFEHTDFLVDKFKNIYE